MKVIMVKENIFGVVFCLVKFDYIEKKFENFFDVNYLSLIIIILEELCFCGL